MTVQYASVQFNSSIPTIGLFSIFTSSAWVLTSAIKCWDRKWLQTIYDSYQTAEDVKKLDLVLLSHFHLVAFKIFKGMTRERQGNDKGTIWPHNLLRSCWRGQDHAGALWSAQALRGTAWHCVASHFHPLFLWKHMSCEMRPYLTEVLGYHGRSA